MLRVTEKNEAEKGDRESRCGILGILEGEFWFYEEELFEGDILMVASKCPD